LASYLKTLPPSDDPQKLYITLRAPTIKIVNAQYIIDQLLKPPAKK